MSFKRLVTAAIFVVTALLTGCAHPISVTVSDFSQIKVSSPNKIKKAVGYYIAPDDLQREVITPGGGGDKISYKPYRDLEPALYKSLSEVFVSVNRLTSKEATGDVELVMVPKIVTNSSSGSLLTWPPTLFTIELTCSFYDKAGAGVTDVKVLGRGQAEFSEFKSDFSLAAKRAAQDAMTNLVKAMESSPKLTP